MKTILFAAVLLSLSLPAYAAQEAAAGSAAKATAAEPATTPQKETAKEDDKCSSGREQHSALCNYEKSSDHKKGSHKGGDAKLKSITLHKKPQTLKPLF